VGVDVEAPSCRAPFLDVALPLIHDALGHTSLCTIAIYTNFNRELRTVRSNRSTA